MTAHHPLLSFWHSHPFIRLLLPLVAGIAVADAGDGFPNIPFSLTLAALAVSWIALTVCFIICKPGHWEVRGVFGMAITLFFFLLGWLLCTHHWQRIQTQWQEQPQLYEARLTDYPSTKPRSTLCPVRVEAIVCGDTLHQMETDILLYLPKDSLASSLQAGDRLRFYGKISPPHNFTEEFDYVRYLYHRHVSGTLYTRQWQLTDTVASRWNDHALRMRNRVLDYYRSAGLSGNELAVFSALTVGYKRELDKEVREDYAISGAGHILALSGLHVGILCAVLVGLFSLALPGIRWQKLRNLCVLPFLWAFVWIAGCPASAVRAALMFTLFAVGNCFTPYGLPMNTWALAAFCMLVYNPFYLFDAGFQMSFVAVASILLLQPWIYRWFPRLRNPLLHYLWGLTSVSLAAQIGLFPLILFYFSRISPYSLVVNLWLIPLADLIVRVAVLLLAVWILPFAPLQQAVGWCASSLVKAMNGLLSRFALLPGADVTGWSINAGELVCLYALLFFLFHGLMHWEQAGYAQTRQHRARTVIAILASLCAMAFCRIFF